MMLIVTDPESDEDDTISLYQKLGEAYSVPPWEIPKRLTVVQWLAFFLREPPPRSHEEAVERVNAARAKKGMPPLKTGLPSCMTEGKDEAR